MGVRKIGVEEELLLVDPASRRLKPVSRGVVAAAGTMDTDETAGESVGPAETVEAELFRPQIETATEPCRTLDELDHEIRRCREVATTAAASQGAAAVAVATPVLDEAEVATTRNPRYERIVHDFGATAERMVVCGMHVHVDVSDEDEGVGVLDGVRPWLPVLLALSVNSPFAWGRDTGHASWRSQVWGRWPTAGPTEPYGNAESYRAATQALVESRAALDRGMLYLDARLAEAYPTVEIRVADVCTQVEDAVLVAALTRALTETAAAEWRRGEAAPAWRTELVRAASWRASRFGMSDKLLHPVNRTLVPAREASLALMHHTADALDEAGDRGRVAALFEELTRRGSGAARQHAAAAAGGSLEAVVDDLARRTGSAPTMRA